MSERYTPEDAIAIVTSTAPGGSATIGEHRDYAPLALRHLRNLGFELAPVSRTLAPGDPDHPGSQVRRVVNAETPSGEAREVREDGPQGDAPAVAAEAPSEDPR